MLRKSGWSRRYDLHAIAYGIAEVLMLPALLVAGYVVVIFVAAATDTLP